MRKRKTMHIHQEGTSGDEDCVYLLDRQARVSYRIIDDCSPEVYTRMLEHGWRRFGRMFFRPACEACGECRSLRIPVERFKPNRSMRRSIAANKDLETVLQPVSLSPQHLQLYDRYHADMTDRKGWKETASDPFGYYQTFVDGDHEFAYELLFRAGKRLLGVALIDILPTAISAVYCYYEPEERRRGLGVFSVLHHINLARARGIPHVYMGYWVEGNASMRYKAHYRPHEILAGRPAFREEPDWRP